MRKTALKQSACYFKEILMQGFGFRAGYEDRYFGFLEDAATSNLGDAAFLTLPVLRHLTHTLTRRTVPLGKRTLTFWMFK